MSNSDLKNTFNEHNCKRANHFDAIIQVPKIKSCQNAKVYSLPIITSIGKKEYKEGLL